MLPVTRSTSCNGTSIQGCQTFSDVQVKSSPEGLTQTLASSPGTLHDLRRRPQGMVFLLKIDNTAPMRRTKLAKSNTPLKLRRAARTAHHLRNTLFFLARFDGEEPVVFHVQTPSSTSRDLS